MTRRSLWLCVGASVPLITAALFPPVRWRTECSDDIDGYTGVAAYVGPLERVAPAEWRWQWIASAIRTAGTIELSSSDARGRPTIIQVSYRPMVVWEVLLVECAVLSAVMGAAAFVSWLAARRARPAQIWTAAAGVGGIVLTTVLVPVRVEERVVNCGWRPGKAGARGSWTESVGEWQPVTADVRAGWRHLAERLASWRPIWQVRQRREPPYEFQFGGRRASANYRVTIDWPVLGGVQVGVLLCVGTVALVVGRRRRRRVWAMREIEHRAEPPADCGKAPSEV